ncbi:MAG TPA: ergothioneine biosynthesis protein EgtB [Burkholderiales bacterium]|nr:ergothioneine biosynthesis protein EgtB [Burkholderiales bacterium]
MPAYARLVSGSAVDAAPLARQYQSIRLATEALSAPLSDEDCAVQSMPDCSPAKWHLAHTTWFFETFVLEKQIADYRHFDPQYRVLFNSYYQTVGAQHARPQRGLLTRPSRREVMAYRCAIDQQLLELLSRGVCAEVACVIELGLQHEQQHQELLLTDIKHLFGCNPLAPAYKGGERLIPHGTPGAVEWLRFGSGLHSFGHEGLRFAFDNEGPRHRAYLNAFELASRPVSNGEYLEFMHDGGYARPELWLSAGWDTVRAQNWQAPLYWQMRDGRWFVHTLRGVRELALDEPACHLSFFEADAYARYAGARLPTEYEWEWAAAGVPVEGNLLESDSLHPMPSTEETHGLHQLYGDVWEWTASSYSAYPGYKPVAGALGEYNGKFMCNQFVLRGGSCATPRTHIRASYRNFFGPEARWQFSGLRLARDA